MIRALPILTVGILVGPMLAGLWGTVLPAFGHLPAAGFNGPSLEPFVRLAQWQGLGAAVRLSITTGLLATLVSLSVVTLILAGWSGTRTFIALERLLSPILAVPHAAAAFGLAFLIAPSGWIMRVAAMILGIERPPDLLIIGDPWGLALTAGLVAKEVPFLLLMALAALPQARSGASLAVARSLGYGRVTGWLKAVFPRVYAQIRLPVYVVLAYSMSVVDVAVILGPTTPPTLSTQIVDWMSAPDLARRLDAAAAALLQFGLVAAALAVWRLAERVIAGWGATWAAGGRRRCGDAALRAGGLALGLVSVGAVLAGLASLVAWSVAGPWRFPDLLPDAATGRNWIRQAQTLADTGRDTVLVAAAASGLGLALAIGCLQAEFRRARPLTAAGLWLLYIPLLVPQTAFLPGLQTFLLMLGAGTGVWPVIAAHLVFVFPYIFLSLSEPWRAWDTRHAGVASTLGAGPVRILFHVRIPMLAAPMLTALAVGFAVSVGQYLPTLLVGGGRVATLTTEAVTLASGGDRRAIGVIAVAQTLAALLPFALALLLPALIFRNRRGLRG